MKDIKKNYYLKGEEVFHKECRRKIRKEDMGCYGFMFCKYCSDKKGDGSLVGFVMEIEDVLLRRRRMDKRKLLEGKINQKYLESELSKLTTK